MSSFNIDRVKSIVRDSKNVIIFDIGAHNFMDSITLKMAYPNSAVYAFEPDNKNIQKYSPLAKNYGVNVVEIALSDEVGETTFYNSESLNGSEWTCSGSILKPVTIDGTSEGVYHKGLLYNLTGYKVRTTTFTDFCDSHNIVPSIVHMDVQGAETKVIKGMGNYRPKVIFAETCEFDTYETNTNLQQFDELMKSLNYEVVERLEYDTFYVYTS